MQSHRLDTFKLSADPQFVEKVRDIVGLYLCPPDHAIVLSMDEDSQVQALDRTRPLWVGNRLTAAVVNPRGATFVVGAITPLFEHQRRDGQGSSYDVSADGQRFLVHTPAEESVPVTLLINRPALLEQARVSG